MSRESLAAVPDDGSDPEIERRLRADQLDEHAPRIGWYADEAMAEMELRGSGVTRPIATPWGAINGLLGGGLWPGLHVLSGTTGTGKTQLALQAAITAAEAGTPTLYVALELNRAELLARSLSLLSTEIPGRGGRPFMWSDLYLGRGGGIALEEARNAGLVERLRRMPLRIEEAPAGEWTASQLGGRALALREYRGAGRTPLVVVDYLQIVGPENPRDDLRASIRSAALTARNVARQGAAVLLLSSVARDKARFLTPSADEYVHPTAPGKNGTDDPGALVGLGKESGEIEYSADTVLTLVPEAFRGGPRTMHVAAAKVRAGRPGWVALTFDGSTFSEKCALRGEA